VDDRELHRRILEGDEESIEYLLVDLCGLTLHFLARTYSCDDLLAQVYLLISENDWRRLRSWSGEGSLSAWVRTVALRICLREVKDRRRLQPLGDGKEIPAAGPAGERRIDTRDLMEAIGKLSKREQAVLILCELEGWSADEVAKSLRMSRANVYTINFRARAKVRKELGL
jgi:RNA polymerase sigma-70 factor (ECF subfamily)